MSIIQAMLAEGTPTPEIEFVGMAFTSASGSSTINISIPAGAASGDLLAVLGFNVDEPISAASRRPSNTALSRPETDVAYGAQGSGDTSVRLTFNRAVTGRYGVAVIRNASVLNTDVNSTDQIPGGTFLAGTGTRGIQLACLFDNAGGSLSVPSGWTSISDITYSGARYLFVRRSVGGGSTSAQAVDSACDVVISVNTQISL